MRIPHPHPDSVGPRALSRPNATTRPGGGAPTRDGERAGEDGTAPALPVPWRREGAGLVSTGLTGRW